jgi:hypothetical protein
MVEKLTKTRLTTVCQDCLNKIPNKVIQTFLVESSKSPHYIFLCKECKLKRK